MNGIEIPEVLEALSKLAWPVLSAVLIWKLYPSIRQIIDSRSFKIKIGEMEVSVQQASDQLRIQLEDLQRAVARQKTFAELPDVEEATATPASQGKVYRVLWVDDNPANNAYEIAKLKSDGFEVFQTRSTADALGIIQGGDIEVDAIVSDMGRKEEGRYNPDAGLNFIEQARTAGIRKPIFVYTTARHVARTRDRVAQAGGNGTTKSALELFEMIQQDTLKTA